MGKHADVILTRSLVMADFTDDDRRTITRAHTRIDDLQGIVVALTEQNKYQEARLRKSEAVMEEHMRKEELMWAKMNTNFDSLLRYKWIALGIICTLLVISADSPIAQALLKLIH